MTQLLENITRYQQRVNQQLSQHLKSTAPTSQKLTDAMTYGALLGGKRVRPFLVYAVGEMLGSPIEKLDPLACAIECIHAYSLIHDDLPAMDDDALRRGQKTCHVAFDEATAILAGDALQTLAFDIISTPIEGVSAKTQLKIVNMLAKASGESGMCGGQALDLEAENKQITLKSLEKIHSAKTGALIEVAVALGASSDETLAPEHQQQLQLFSHAIGLAFQVQDDILDIISDTKTLGKPQGSDVAHHKSTYPALLGLEQAIAKAQSLCQEALHALAQLPYNTQLLESFALYIIKRDR
ncbi:(2E,6E)-farnesyl diphosphate synthase [Psychromonas hadalis]|uniref:(2E,6E)-farnesyl diphosphate synthase n=1 Tax=Psychromonas hadalis TaxID=211669 RepID=UPI0003B5517E|nr:(2E,6E)-farnesyl diphosphate synthase [Psychromonas hadalis]